MLNDAGERLASLPVLVLNAHSRCNCRCVMCDIWKRNEATEVTAAALDRHRESIRRLKVEWVVLSGGEPLMHRDLGSLCSFFRDLDIRVTLLTTGLLLAKRAAEVVAFFDDVIVSLDGPPEIHNAIRRVNGAFEHIRSGVRTVRELHPDMRITARTTVQKANHAQLLATVRSAQAIGLNGISFLAADLTSEAFNRPVIWPDERQNEIGLTLDEIEVLDRSIDDLVIWSAECGNAGFIAESPAKLRRIAQHFRAQLGLVSFVAPKCNAPWVSAVIEADGNVRPCFFHPALGNIHHEPLDEIINGDVARAFRGELNVESNPVCQKCVCSLYRARPIEL